jgi:hypothetical protein
VFFLIILLVVYSNVLPDVDPQTTTYYQCVKSKVYGLVAVIVVSNSDQIKPAI